MAHNLSITSLQLRRKSKMPFWNSLRSAIRVVSTIRILPSPTHEADGLRDFQSSLHISGIPYKNIENSDNGDKDGIVLSTMHNMKGLEFKVVIITGINQSSFPSKPYNWNGMDKREQTNHIMNQRSLMYVAITRAMQKVLITGVGVKSLLLK